MTPNQRAERYTEWSIGIPRGRRREVLEQEFEVAEQASAATMKERCAEIIGEAEYAMVGGNDIKEDIPWETADSWFRWMEDKIRDQVGD